MGLPKLLSRRLHSVSFLYVQNRPLLSLLARCTGALPSIEHMSSRRAEPIVGRIVAVLLRQGQKRSCPPCVALPLALGRPGQHRCTCGAGAGFTEACGLQTRSPQKGRAVNPKPLGHTDLRSYTLEG